MIFINEFLDIEEQKIKIYTESIANNLNKDIENIFSKIDYLSFTIDPHIIKDKKKTSLIIDQFIKKNIIFKKITLYDLSGKIITSSDLSDSNQLKLIEYYEIDNLNITEASVKSIYKDNKFSIIFYKVLIQNNKNYGYIISELNINDNNLPIYNSIILPEYYEWRSFLTDKRGYLIYHSHLNANNLSLQTRDYSNFPSINKALFGNYGLTTIKKDKITYYSSSEIISLSDWIFIVEIPKYLITGKVNRLINTQTLYISIFIIFLSGIIFILLNSLIKPIEILTTSLQKYGKNNNINPIQIKSNNEISKAIAAFNKMITDRNVLEKEIIDIIEKEHFRIGMDLHDDVGQLLTGISFKILLLDEELKTKNIFSINTINEISDYLGEAINKIKLIAKGLNPIDIHENSIINAIDEYLIKIENFYKIKCCFKYNKNIKINNKIKALNIYKILLESISNSIKHGKPSKIKVIIKEKNGIITLKIIDNGKGFYKNQSKGMGLKIMKYRSNLIEGIFNITGKVNCGTVVKLIVRII